MTNQKFLKNRCQQSPAANQAVEGHDHDYHQFRSTIADLARMDTLKTN